MARTGSFNADDLIADFLGEPWSVVMLGREWVLNPDVPIYVEQQWTEELSGAAPEDETIAQRLERLAKVHSRIIDEAYGKGSYDEFVKLGGGRWRRIALVRAALAYYRGEDPQAELEALFKAVQGNPDSQDEAAEQAAADAEGNVEGA